MPNKVILQTPYWRSVWDRESSRSEIELNAIAQALGFRFVGSQLNRSRYSRGEEKCPGSSEFFLFVSDTKLFGANLNKSAVCFYIPVKSCGL